MVAYVKERLEGDDYDLGNIYLRASWEAESEQLPLVHQYQALAIARYDAFLKRDPVARKIGGTLRLLPQSWIDCSAASMPLRRGSMAYQRDPTVA
jgi:hypothetical protein